MGSRGKILRLITRLNIGGPARQALLLTRELAADYPTVLAAGHSPLEEGELTDPFVDIARIPLVRPLRPHKDVAAFRAVRSLLRKYQPRIIHSHMAKAGTIGRLAATGTNVRTVHTFHGHVLEGYFSPIVERAFTRTERFLAARTDILIAVSTEVRDALLDRGVGRPWQFRVVPLGFELDEFLAVAGKTGSFRTRLALDLQTPLVVVISRIASIKDHATLLRAIAKLEWAHLAVVGDGELREETESLAADLGIAERTHFVGWTLDVPAVLADADVVVLTSRNEGTPVSLIEAAAAGRPVVATSVGGTRSVVRDGVTGLLVPPGQPSAVSSAIQRLLDDRELAARLGRAGRQHVATRFSHRRLLDDVKSLYDDLTA